MKNVKGNIRTSSFYKVLEEPCTARIGRSERLKASFVFISRSHFHKCEHYLGTTVPGTNVKRCFQVFVAEQVVRSVVEKQTNYFWAPCVADIDQRCFPS